jgi:hypothetical protein
VTGGDGPVGAPLQMCHGRRPWRPVIEVQRPSLGVYLFTFPERQLIIAAKAALPEGPDSNHEVLGRSALCLLLAGGVRLNSPSVLALHQRRQLGDVGRDAPRFVIGEDFGLHRVGFVRPAVDVGKRFNFGPCARRER